MAELSEEICQAYEEAQAAELLARQHPEHLEHSLRAANHFERAAVLSQRQAEDEEYVEEVRHVALVLAKYYFAQMHKSRGWHAYERRDCGTALAELEQEKQHLQCAVRDAEGLMPALSEEGKAFLGPQLQSWKVSLAALPSTEYACRARLAWDQGNTVQAIDWYRHSVADAEKVLELEKQVPPAVNPASRRVMRGNMYSTIANASQTAAKILLDQAKRDRRSLYDFSREEGLQFLGHFLDAHRAGMAAMTENPEWEQIGMATQACRGNIEQFLRDTKEHWALIYSRYQGNSTLEMLMRHMDPERYAKASSGVDASAGAAKSVPRSEAGRAVGMIKVLLLSANPIDAPLSIEEEFRAIDAKMAFRTASTDVATCRYYTGLDPFTKKEVYGARHLRDRKMRWALRQFSEPEN